VCGGEGVVLKSPKKRDVKGESSLSSLSHLSLSLSLSLLSLSL